MKIFSKFESIANELLGPLLGCNRRLFSRFLDHMIDLEDNLRNEDFHRFYAFLPPEGPSITFSNKIRSVAKQVPSMPTPFPVGEVLKCTMRWGERGTLKV